MSKPWWWLRLVVTPFSGIFGEMKQIYIKAEQIYMWEGLSVDNRVFCLYN